MIFHELYGTYFQTVTAVLAEAVDGTLTGERIRQIVQEKAFAESLLTIPEALLHQTWPLLDAELHTPLQHRPEMPLTALQKRWLKSLLLDARIQLFAPSTEGLEDVAPLYRPEQIVYFDQYQDGDPYTAPDYIVNFQTILTAMREQRKLRIDFCDHHGQRHVWICRPCRLEYSAKDDKFRLLTEQRTINLARIAHCQLLEACSDEAVWVQPQKNTLVLELTDERNALERAMLHFSHLEKKAERLDEKRYRLTLQYDHADETELLIRVLSFGPLLQVTAPQSFVKQMKKRIMQQKKLWAQS